MPRPPASPMVQRRFCYQSRDEGLRAAWPFRPFALFLVLSLFVFSHLSSLSVCVPSLPSLLHCCAGNEKESQKEESEGREREKKSVARAYRA